VFGLAVTKTCRLLKCFHHRLTFYVDRYFPVCPFRRVTIHVKRFVVA